MKFQSAIFPSCYIQGPETISLLPEWITKLGTKAIVIAGKTAIRDILPALAGNENSDFIIASFGGECTLAEVNRIAAIARKEGCDVSVAIGGGKVIDTAKAVADALNAKMIIVPTIASNDAPCSAISVIYTEKGAFDHVIHLKNNPNLVLVDSQIIANAPARLLVAGMGDALSTWFEADACRASSSLNEAGGYATRAALTLARLCYDTLLQYGAEALESCKLNQVSPALEHIIEANTLMSGLGFESAGLASAHAIHNGLTQLPATHACFHGEKVAFGVLTGLFLAGRPDALIEEVYTFCKSVGLPVTLAEIGVINPTEAELYLVAGASCATGESIWHEPSSISPDRVVACLKMADERGRKQL